jgi:PAS domain S-box-containing protein
MADFGGRSGEREKFFDTIDLCPVAMLVTDPTQPDNPIRLANAAFSALTGYEKSEIVGRNCRFMTGPDTDPAASDELRKAIQQERPAVVDVLNYRRDGTPFRNGVMITPLFDINGKLEWFLGSQVDLGKPETGGLAPRKRRAESCISLLTPRQQQVLELMSHGLLTKQIAWRLKISTKTVEAHRMQLLQRLDVGTSAEAIRLAIEAGL